MDFQRFGIDPRLAQAASDLPTGFYFYEKMLAHAVAGEENLCVKIALDNGREEVLLLPALQWILSGESRRVLVVAADEAGAERCAAAVGRLGAGAGLSVCRAFSEEPGRLEGDPAAHVVVGTLQAVMAAPGVELRGFGFLVVDGVERLAEQPSETIRKFIGSLLPSWERRSVLACAKFSVKAKNLAWDLADNPSEISIEGEVAKAQSVLKETWSVPVEAKLRFLLGLIARENPPRLCVFCNLRDTAAEVSRRLAGNGVRTDAILGPLSEERKFALIEKFRAGDCTCLALSDEGAEGLTPGVFPLVVNYDIPLEPELFVRRLEMLDRSDSGAKVVSLACDRYIYGLPAVEQYIDARLEPLPAGEEMFAAVDRSESSGGDRRQRGESYPKEPRRGGQQRRDGRPRDEGRRDSRNPDIRMSISEATGGALDMGGSSAQGPAVQKQTREQPATKRQAPRDSGQGTRTNRNGGGNKDPRREDAARRNGRPPQPKPSESRGKQQQKSARWQGIPKTVNPYDLPMEERMRLYRQKYGRALDEGTGSPAKGKPGTASGRGDPSRGGRGQSSSDDGHEKPPRAMEGKQGESTQPSVEGRVERKGEGVMGKFFGALRKKKE